MSDLSSDIEVERVGDVVTIRFNRPEKRNAITTAMYAQLADELGQADADGAAVVVLTGAGGAFTASNDLGTWLRIRCAARTRRRAGFCRR